MDGFHEEHLTPAMHQYAAVKKKHPDCITLFRMGDFYETFYDDAKVCARELEITLTSRGKGEKRAPLAGIPYHALDNYLAKLVKRGYKVAIVEQMEDPKKAKGIVKRDVVRIVTPGTVIESNLLDARANNYIISLYQHDDKYGLACVDISTGEFTVFSTAEQQLDAELARLQPAECLIPASLGMHTAHIKKCGTVIQAYPDPFFTVKSATEALTTHFNVASLTGLGLDDSLLVQAAGGLLHYLKETQKCSLNHITKVRQRSEFMHLDSSTVRNLEIFRNIRDNGQQGTLIAVVDKTRTSMGARLLKKWIMYPLLEEQKINARLTAVDELVHQQAVRQDLARALQQIQDIERITCRITYGTALPRELLSLAQSLSVIPDLRATLDRTQCTLLREFIACDPCTNVVSALTALSSDPPATIREGHIFAAGHNPELDTLRQYAGESKEWIAALEQKERERTGIKNLKIGYNRVFGYFILLSKGQMDKAPDDYIRKQTIATGERYVTPELKEKEELLLHAEERMHELEYTLYMDLLARLQKEAAAMQALAAAVAQVDVLLSFAECAREYRYCRPMITTDGLLRLEGARHPVVEQLERRYVPNDLLLSSVDRTIIITGPNMSGKSTLMRSIAQIQLLAQVGSYVPCAAASISLADRIFTRVGAYDDLTHGQSTFMVEMAETANIMNNATAQSLVIVDELGRGTSTFDGIALAYAVAVHLHQHIKARTLFATHYHQMNKLAEALQGVRNYHMQIKESGDDIIFLRQFVLGGTDKSYGIHVAKLAGLPLPVLETAQAIMKQLEAEDKIAGKMGQRKDTPTALTNYF